MSLDKSIESGRERRKPYEGAKAVDCKCRNHGSCPACREQRLHKQKKRMPEPEYECEKCFDTGCVCGGIGLSCHGCCDCDTAIDPYS